MRFVFALALMASPAWAERVECEFHIPCIGIGACIEGPLPVSFEIDHRQFAPPVSPQEPPRNKVTLVSLGEERFKAEPIVLDDGTRGFWANLGGVDHLMTMRPDGRGTYSTSGGIPLMTGLCETTERT